MASLPVKELDVKMTSSESQEPATEPPRPAKTPKIWTGQEKKPPPTPLAKQTPAEESTVAPPKQFEVWVEKYRPRRIEEISGQERVKKLLLDVLAAGKGNMPHMLFYGPPGTGKTTSALALCNGLFGGSLEGNVLELNASDERGIDSVRNKVKGFASHSTGSGFKIIILDEADSMTNDAQSALRRIIELYTEKTRFIIICNYQSRIMGALASRCSRFHFSGVSKEHQISRIKMICEKEELDLEDGALEAAIAIGGGDLRRTLTLLQGVRSFYGHIRVTATQVQEVAGAIPQEVIANVLDGVANKQTVVELKDMVRHEVIRAGYNGYQLVRQLTDVVEERVGTSFLPEHKFPEVAQLFGDTDHRMVQSADEEIELYNFFMKLWWLLGPRGNTPTKRE